MEVFVHSQMERTGATEEPDTPTSPQAVLNKFYSTTNTSPTLLLYNLEVRFTLSTCTIISKTISARLRKSNNIYMCTCSVQALLD